MDSSISGWFSGEYPYTMPTHLGGRSSNLTSLLIIGIPFYLLGDVGYLQSASFLLFAFLLYKSLSNLRAKLLGIILLVTSVSYMWEIFAKSDLMSNFIIIIGFMVLYFKRFGNQIIKNPVQVGGAASFLFFTRLVTAIPMVLLLFKGFLEVPWRGKILFSISFFITSLILVVIVLLNAPSLEIVREYNPILLQNRQLPLALSLITISLPFFFSKRINSIDQLIKFSILFLFIPVFTAFTIYIVKHGFFNTIILSMFDISYFNIILPFIIFYLAYGYDKILSERNLQPSTLT
jgi:hypothetical protein